MLVPQGEVEGRDEASGRLDPAHEDQLDRVRRRASALERQLEARIAQADALDDPHADQAQRPAAPAGEEVAAARDEAARARHQADLLAAKAAEYDALMGTFTMRALRLPRAWYGAVRRRLAGAPRP